MFLGAILGSFVVAKEVGLFLPELVLQWFFFGVVMVLGTRTIVSAGPCACCPKWKEREISQSQEISFEEDTEVGVEDAKAQSLSRPLPAQSAENFS